MTENILELENVSKKYASKLAVDSVSFSIPRASIFGLLGPNGAGKTSIIRMITSITAPDSGTIKFNGELLKDSHISQIGYLPEERGLYKKMRVGEHLEYIFELRGKSIKEAKKLSAFWLEKLGLEAWNMHEVVELSKGMQQKVQFIATVGHEPQLLILDEPFSGLDPINAQIIEDEIKRLREQGTTIIFSTHRMEQVEDLCDRFVLVNQGKLVLESGLKEARKNFQREEYHIEYDGDSAFFDGITMATLSDQKAGSVTLKLNAGKTATDLWEFLKQEGGRIQTFKKHQPRLHEIFIQTIEESNSSNE